MEMRIWEGGRWKADPAAEIRGSRGYCHGLGLFETMLAVKGRLVASELHFQRLEEGCRRLGFERPDLEVLGRGVEALLGDGPPQRVRLHLSAEAGPLGVLEGVKWRASVALDEVAKPPEKVKVVVSPWPRNERSPLAGIKCGSYAENLMALDHARRRGADEAVFANTRGELCEAATANVFLVMDGVLVTPGLGSGCLPGTMRERVIGLAESEGIELREETLLMERCGGAEEVFLTSATRGVVGVSRWAERELGPGPLSRRLRERVLGGLWA